MRSLLNNQNRRDSAAVLLAGLTLGGWSLYRLHSAAVKTAWILSPWLFPLLLSVMALLLAAALWTEKEENKRQERAWRLPLAVLLISAAYAALLPLLRFLPASALYLAALLRLLGERRWWLIALIAVLLPLLLYALFGLGLQVRLP